MQQVIANEFRAKDGARKLRRSLAFTPTEVINNVGDFLSDDWTPIPVTSRHGRVASQLIRNLNTMVYPEERLESAADDVDVMVPYADPWGSRGQTVEGDRTTVARWFSDAGNLDIDMAHINLMRAASYDNYRWLTQTGYTHVEAATSVINHSLGFGVVLPSSRHVLQSTGKALDAVLFGNNGARAAADLREQVNTLRAVVVMLKATFMLMILETPVAEAGRYEAVAEGTAQVLLFAIDSAAFFACWLIDAFEWACSELVADPGPVRQYVELLALWLVIVKLCRVLYDWVKPREFKLVKAEVEKRNEFAIVKNREYTPSGWVYEFEHEGQIIRAVDQISGLAGNGIAHNVVDEMALPGSNHFPSKKQPVGAIYVATDSVEIKQIGCFFRYKDCLVTAKHVARMIDAGVATAYAGGVALDNKGLCRMDAKLLSLPVDFFSEDNNKLVVDLDLFVAKLTPAQWSRLPGIHNIASKPSHYGMIVNSVGFQGDLMVAAPGKTLADSGSIYLWHSASTAKGHSGSPLLCGKYLVGVHIQGSEVGSEKKNIAVRAEYLEAYASFEGDDEAYDYTSDAPKIEHDVHGFKFNGHRATIDEFEDEYVYLSKEGLVWLSYDRDDVQRMNPGYFGREEEEDTLDREASGPRRAVATILYEDECNDIGAAPVVKRGVVQLEREAPVYCARTEPEYPEAVQYLDSKTEQLEKLGYDATKYVWPNISKELETKSLRKHLAKFVERSMTITSPPTELEKERTAHAVLELLKNNRYVPKPGYKTLANIRRILDSSLVKDSKSPGHPYQGNGLATNGRVLEQYTLDGFSEIVVQEWDSKYDLKVFIKGEPTKKKKIDDDMPRCITGMPLHKMTKHQAIFEDLVSASVDNWGISPVVGGFSPVVGGNIQNLADRFKGRKIYGSDKPCWDYMFHGYLFEILEEVLVNLAVQTEDWTEEGWVEYLADVRNAVREVSTEARYRCSDGTVWTTSENGAMKSGWVLTFLANSIGQLIVDNLIKLRMGVTLEEVLSKEHAIMVGGDDVLQTFPDEFDTDRYREIGAGLGLELEEFVVEPSFDGVEFFSHTFTIGEGVWQYHPTRFTKHVAKLRHVKLDNLPDALVNHMRNHVWNKSKFTFLHNMYMALRKSHPNLFPLGKIRTRQQLMLCVTGREASC